MELLASLNEYDMSKHVDQNRHSVQVDFLDSNAPNTFIECQWFISKEQPTVKLQTKQSSVGLTSQESESSQSMTASPVKYDDILEEEKTSDNNDLSVHDSTLSVT